MNDAPAVYRPRNPKASGWYRCVEDYFEEFVRVYDERFAAKFGFWKPHIEKVIHRFLDCARLDGQYPKCAMEGVLTKGAGLFTTVLPASAVVTAVMSFLSPFPVMEEIFVHHAIKSASSSSGSFSAPRYWQKFPIGTSFSHSPRSFGVISYTIANFLGK